MKSLFVALFAALLLASPAAAQPMNCGTVQYPVKGCMDSPTQGTTLSAATVTVLAGWSGSAITLQRPDHVAVYVGGFGLVSPSQYSISWGYRQDIAAYMGSSADFGYTIWIWPGVLSPGNWTIAVNFADSASGSGINSQQVNVNVVP
jgi:hypothetical protein